MAIKHVVVDWNGTLCDMVDDTFVMRRIAVAILKWHFKAILNGRIDRIGAVARFARGRVALGRAKRRFYSGEIGIASLYEPFNRDMLEGAPIHLVEAVAEAYGRQHAYRLDQRLLGPALAARDGGATLTIFSAAYDGGVRAILKAAGVDIDDVVSNTLENVDGRAIGFTAKYRDDKSGDFRREFIERRGWLPEEIVYAGDAQVDEPIAGLLPPGNFVVPFLADDRFEAHMRTTYGALTPEGPGDLAALLGR